MDLKNFLVRYWAIIIVVLIIFLGMYVRTIDYRWPYLRNIDSYAFMKQMNMIIDNNGLMPNYDYLDQAPYGHPVPTNYPFFYQYLGAWGYMLFKSFMPNLELWQYLIYLPALLASLMAIPMYFIGKILYDKRAGIIAAFFIVFDVAVMSRTLGGDPDSDAFTLLLPLIVIALFLITYKYIDLKKVLDKKAVMYSVLTGIFLGIWAYSWAGWWYVVWLITGFLVLKLITNYLQSRKEFIHNSKCILLMFVIMAITYFCMTVPILGVSHIVSTVQGPFTFGDIKSEAGEFPNVYVSVAEMQESGDIRNIIQRTSAIGGIAIIISPFFLMLYCLIYLFYSYYRKKQHLDTIILLSIWFIGPLLATIIAVRFSILFSAPMAIGSAILLSKLLRVITENEKLED
ncbi:MAG: STT3 domain-containing protein [Candidatus Aenigmatarchaeota archaeon]